MCYDNPVSRSYVTNNILSAVQKRAVLLENGRYYVYGFVFRALLLIEYFVVYCVKTVII